MGTLRIFGAAAKSRTGHLPKHRSDALRHSLAAGYFVFLDSHNRKSLKMSSYVLPKITRAPAAPNPTQS